MKNMRSGLPNLFKSGSRHLQGRDQTVSRNIEACQQLAALTRTSLGPNGMNKMVINHLEKLYVTSDATTIISQSEIEHPAAKLLVLAAQMQEQEVGDGSNFVIAFGGQLLSQAEILIRMGLHVNDIAAGFDLAYKKALEIFSELCAWKMETRELFDKQNLVKGIRSVIASKQYGNETLLASLIADAALAVLPENTHNFNVDNIRVSKLMGGGLNQSEVVRGVVVAHDVQGTISSVKNAKVAVFTCPVDASSTETKGTILIENADQLLNYSEGEETSMHASIKALKDHGVDVVVTGGSIGEMAQHFLDKYKILTIKISSQYELRRLARSTNSRLLVKLAVQSADDLGFCSSVYVREIGLNKVTIFQQASKDTSGVATIILRGSTQNHLEDVERAVDDGINVVKAIGRDARFMAGAGAWQIELARRLQEYASHKAGLEQYAVKAYADALEVVPRTLAENAGLTAMDVISQLYAAHENKQIHVGVNIEEGGVKDALELNVYDHLYTNEQALKLATNVAMTVLRVDQIIMSKPAGGPKAPKENANWDDD